MDRDQNDQNHNRGLELTDTQRIDWLRLTRSEGVGPRTFKALINRYGSASDAVEALPELVATQGRSAKIYSRADAEAEMDIAARHGVRFIGMGEPDFPRLLRVIDACPPLIALRGSARIFSRPSVGIVGSRNASALGLKLAEIFARGLGQHHCLIISGLARGIDAAAHRTSLETGTVAVLAGGHDRIYPPEHRDLLDAILETGAVISEMPMGWEPRGRDFPRRNRIISGLSHGVLLVEAAMRSGSLITARFAGEQGRDVFAIPGSPLDPRAEGTNDLIRNGATLVTTPEHILESLAPIFGRDDWPPAAFEAGKETDEPLWDELEIFVEKAPLHAREEAADYGGATTPKDTVTSSTEFDVAISTLQHMIGPSPISVDDLVRLTGIPVRVVQIILFDLEMQGEIVRHGVGMVSATPRDTTSNAVR